MLRKVLFAAAIAALASTGVAQSSEELPIEWTISPTQAAGNVHLSLSSRTRGGGQNMNSTEWPLSDLQGLSPAQLGSAEGTPVRFRIVREAGLIDCEGMMRRERGTGECSFAPDAGYAAALERRGIGRPSVRQQYQLAVSNARMALFEELERQGYERPSIDDLVGAAIHGVTVPYLKDMAEAGYRLRSMDNLIAFRIHGVTPQYIRELGAISPRYSDLAADDLVGMRIHGVTTEKVRDFAALGYRDLSHSDLVSMSIHGVTAAYVRGLAEAGYSGLSADELVKMRIHGVTLDYVRAFKDRGYALPSADQLVKMRIAGFRPERKRD